MLRERGTELLPKKQKLACFASRLYRRPEVAHSILNRFNSQISDLFFGQKTSGVCSKGDKTLLSISEKKSELR